MLLCPSPALVTPGWLGDEVIFRLGMGGEDCTNALLLMLSTGEPTVPLERPQLSREGKFLLSGGCVRAQSGAALAGRLCLNDAAHSRCPRDSQEVGLRQGTGNESPTAGAKQGLNIETNCLR